MVTKETAISVTRATEKALKRRVHKVPMDLRNALASNSKARAAWEDITPLAQNEWICWVENAKHLETRNRRIMRTKTGLAEGKRRPCCWVGCPHRKRGNK